jgi:L-ascorbate metabolism protein UlaG (beta-lactamase superfamily)
MPTALESHAVELANKLKKLIFVIKALDNNTLNDERAMRRIANSFYENILILVKRTIDDIFREAARNNQFFNVISSITDKRNYDAVSYPTINLSALLKRAKIMPLLHSCLQKFEPTSMTVVLKKRDNNTFREHYTDDQYHKFYNQQTTAKDQPHQDLNHYYKANVAIGSATQKSNLLSLFSSSLSQPKDEYFKPADAEKHKIEKKLFASAINKIEIGKDLTPDEINVLEKGEYYRYPQPQRFSLRNQWLGILESSIPPEDRITHLGHASELIHMHGQSNLMIAVDPVNYQSGTEGIIVKWGATIGYPRKTAAALASEDYPATQVVLLTHNHHDHMCIQSLTEAFSLKNTLFIVPQGDARRLQAQGFENVVEFNTWNDYAEITLVNAEQQKTTFIISSFPAKHASNRFTNDLYNCLYMGFMLRNSENNHTILCTGDTGVLDEEHFKQFEDYLLNEKLFVHKACIASGPDRPRQWMECTHQSTADAITMQAKFNIMNFKSLARKHKVSSVSDLPIEVLIKEGLVQAIGYHQGCFRLGLLSLQDVRTTIIRMLAVLRTVSDMMLTEITEEKLAKNVFYNFMDVFEQKALLQTIRCYQELNVFSITDIYEIITQSFFIPQPGRSWQQEGFEFDYERLIQNRDPLSTSEHIINKPYEYFALKVDPSLYLNITPLPLPDYRPLTRAVFDAYLNRNLSMRSGKNKKLKAFLVKLDNISNEMLSEELGKLYADIFPKQDEGIRDEGHVYTMLTILAGLIHFNAFRTKFHARHQALQSPLVQSQPARHA